MQFGISQFRQGLRRAAATLSATLPERRVLERRTFVAPRDSCDQEDRTTSASRNWMANDELFVLHSESCDIETAGGLIHVGHALHQGIPLPRLESLRYPVSGAEPVSSASAGLQAVAPRHPQPMGSMSDQSSASLRWPEICSRLLAQTRVQFEVAAQNLLTASSHGLCTVAITGHIRGEGRSTVAMCLSRAVARLGGTAALFDGDTSTPDLASQLGTTNLPTWLPSEATAAPVTVGSAGEQVDVFFRNQNQRFPEKHTEYPLGGLVQTARAKYDLVVVDLPPLDCTGRLPISCTHLDVAILVRNCRKTIPEDVCEADRSLRSMGVAAVGVVENFQVL
ncbi:MAG: P-loop NTPase [Planctomycetota bacterium]|nr:P-loop NTPase [Planctomycetota bacterium]